MDFKEWLKGKKTYIVAVATICYALSGVVAGYIPIDQAVMLILGALGLGALRNGVDSSLTNKDNLNLY